MTPAARLQAAIEILVQLQGTRQPADRLLRDWARAHRYAGSKDRAAIAEQVFALLRRRNSYAWRMQDETPRALVLAGLLADGTPPDEIEALFDGSRYAPSALTQDERRRIALPPPAPAPRWVQGEFPAFLETELERAFGADLVAETLALAQRAPVDMRVNTLKTKREAVLAQLQAENYAARATPFSPHGIRIPGGEGLSSLGRHALFASGAFEFQDEAAQIAALLARARPGQRVLDLAAGAGGKALALAAEMENRGEILACDIDAKRLAALDPRVLRAGVSIIRPHLVHGEPPRDRFDLVFVDAPCSGSGVWRRQPELKWRLTESRLADLNALQDRLLDQAAHRLVPGGRLFYATCSVLPRENEDRLVAFRARHPRFRALNAAALWRDIGAEAALPATDDFFRASPYVTGTDGFFAGFLVLGEA